MRQNIIFGCLVSVLVLTLGSHRANAQVMLADEIVILSKGQTEKEKSRTSTHLGGTPGAGGSRLRSPGAPDSRLGQPTGIVASAARTGDILSAASGYEQGRLRQPGPPAIAPTGRAESHLVPLYGRLELPSGGDEGPPNGLTLDMAIERLVHTNPGLRAKFQEIPNAQADILSAGLRANPLVFASAGNVPYGSYSTQRPGQNNYDVTLIQAVDVNRKRTVRVIVAQQAKKVIEAQYQDAVRLEIDNLYTAFVDVLDARETVRYARASVEGLCQVVKTTDEQVKKGLEPQSEVESATIQLDTAEVVLEQAETALRVAKRTLATLIHLAPQEADPLEVRGSIRDPVPPPPPIEDLIRLALCTRPDVVSYRLGVRRAEAAITLERAERFPDVFVLYTPYSFTNYAPQGDKSATSWGIGAMVSLPLINRNQGNIARAQGNLSQTQIELVGLERQVVTDVERAGLEYGSTKGAVERLELSILPRARRLRDQKYGLYTQGQEHIVTYLNAQRDYNEVVRQYRDTLIRHRRSMLRLNTAVGQRILP
ncbi:MAG: TolC family protein [Planctomycetaceae bacterium]|nr:TolC family protein [Planctomycetaceae bacterium]MBV8313247.1 TolC family protein [Planctomycetaceae bacterium]